MDFSPVRIRMTGEGIEVRGDAVSTTRYGQLINWLSNTNVNI
jgi:hypothetical protein